MKASIFVAALFSFMLTARGQNLIDAQYGAGAGSFELGSFTPNDDENMFLPVGSSFLTGWSIGGPGDGVLWIPRDTSKFIDLSHSSASSIFTSPRTNWGHIYSLCIVELTIRSLQVNSPAMAASALAQLHNE